MLKTFSFLIFFLLLLFSNIFISCVEEDGLKCIYETIDVYVIIDSILSVEDYCQKRCELYSSERECRSKNPECYNYNGLYDYYLQKSYLYLSIFRKDNNKNVYKLEKKLVNTDCIFANLFSAGDTIFSGKINFIKSGTCQGIDFKFGYPECF